MLLHVSEIPSFLWLNNIAWYVYITFCLPVHTYMDTWVAFIFILLLAIVLL